jgi:hypothetical protein
MQAAYLDEYGFQGLPMPDPIGLPGQGAGEVNDAPDNTQVHEWTDAEIADQALNWLRERADLGSDKPCCLS